MSLGHRIASGIAKVLPFHNPRVVCPPGTLRPSAGPEPFLIVASMERSGTHLMMDAVFNHFAAYRKSPLYLDLLLCEWEGWFPERAELERCGGYVVKTHFDNSVYAGERHEESIRQLIDLGAVVVLLKRDGAAHRRAQRSFQGAGFDQERFDRRCRAFFDFWEPLADLRVDFEELIDPEVFPLVVDRVASRLSLSPPRPIRLPKRPDQALSNYVDKLSTRLLGPRAPVISTGIGFKKTKHPVTASR